MTDSRQSDTAASLDRSRALASSLRERAGRVDAIADKEGLTEAERRDLWKAAELLRLVAEERERA